MATRTPKTIIPLEGTIRTINKVTMDLERSPSKGLHKAIINPFVNTMPGAVVPKMVPPNRSKQYTDPNSSVKYPTLPPPILRLINLFQSPKGQLAPAALPLALIRDIR